MIISMTGYGKASRTLKKVSINVEMRSINSKYLEITSRLPVIFSDKEGEIKDIIGKKASRGKINVSVTVERSSDGNVMLRIQPEVLKDYYALLTRLKKTINIKDELWELIYELYVRINNYVKTKVSKCIESENHSFFAGIPGR